MMKETEKGSAIMWILIAVGLFAALAFAFNSSNRTSTKLLTDEETTSYANEIISFGNDIKSAVKRMQLRGIDETEFSFGNTVYTNAGGTPNNAPGHNANCTSEKCEFFSNAGGQIQPKFITKQAFEDTPPPNGHVGFVTLPVQDVGTTESELVARIIRVKPEVCARINRLLGISSSDFLPATDSFNTNSYNGNFPSHADPIGDVVTEFQGKRSFCATTQGGNHYIYVQVLIPR